MINILTSAHNGELRGLSREEKGFMCQADPAFWGRTAPILFPIVGLVNGNILRAGGNSYTLKQHGFARDADFEGIGENAYQLRRTGPSENYPHPLELEVLYTIEVDAGIHFLRWYGRRRYSVSKVAGISSNRDYSSLSDRRLHWNSPYLQTL